MIANSQSLESETVADGDLEKNVILTDILQEAIIEKKSNMKNSKELKKTKKASRTLSSKSSNILQTMQNDSSSYGSSHEDTQIITEIGLITEPIFY